MKMFPGLGNRAQRAVVHKTQAQNKTDENNDKQIAT